MFLQYSIVVKFELCLLKIYVIPDLCRVYLKSFGKLWNRIDEDKLAGLCTYWFVQLCKNCVWFFRTTKNARPPDAATGAEVSSPHRSPDLPRPPNAVPPGWLTSERSSTATTCVAHRSVRSYVQSIWISLRISTSCDTWVSLAHWTKHCWYVYYTVDFFWLVVFYEKRSRWNFYQNV